MQSQSEHISVRFENSFSNGGLGNIKFFRKNKSQVSLDDFLREVADFQATIAAGDFEILHSVCDERPRKRFDAPF